MPSRFAQNPKNLFLILECMSESLRWSPLAFDDGEHVVLGDAYFMTHGTYRFPPHYKRMRYSYVSHPQLSKCCYFYEHMATQKCMYCDGIILCFLKENPKFISKQMKNICTVNSPIICHSLMFANLNIFSAIYF